MKHVLLSILAVSLLHSPAFAEEQKRLESFVSPEQVQELSKAPETLIIDVRSADEYARGHIPNAINLPGALWRTAKATPGDGDSQYIFRAKDGRPDVTRYETFLSQAGVKNSNTVVIYGNHAGKADGSIPAMLLRWLGHESVVFLDGVGIEEWQNAGYSLSTEESTRQASQYTAKPRPNFIWNLSEVKAAIGNKEVVFYDTRSPEEFSGVEPRKNKRVGHIPGAVLLNYSDLLDKDKKVIDSEKLAKLHLERGLSKDKTIVLYCQTATRVSLPALALLDLGYENIAIYDASWHEYGNRADTEIVHELDLAAAQQ